MLTDVYETPPHSHCTNKRTPELLNPPSYVDEHETAHTDWIGIFRSINFVPKQLFVSYERRGLNLSTYEKKY